MELIMLERGVVIALNRVLAIVQPKSAPIERMVRQAKERGFLIDMTYGRRTEAVVFFDSGHLALISLSPEEVIKACQVEDLT